MNRRAVQAAVVLSSLVVVACGRRGDVGSRPPADAGNGAPSVDWSNPIGGIPVDTAAEAQGYVAFAVRVPEGVGTVREILVSSPEEVSRESRGVAFLMDHPSLGLVVVIEHFPDVPVEDYEAAAQRVADADDPGTEDGTGRVTTVRGGKPALVTVSPDGSRSTIFWLEDGVEFVVRGPDLNESEALGVIESLELSPVAA
ncbi:MAG: hypothetical protein HY658_04505 [Actinobacteria bacterium]|nr:hypothetical protein [Actinomycetota bacterium]